MNAKGLAGRLFLTQAGHGSPVQPLVGRKSVLMGMAASLGIVATNSVQQSASAAGTVAYVPTWTPFTAYALRQQVISPDNDVVSAKVAHTSSAAYSADQLKWSLSSTYAGLATAYQVVYHGADATVARPPAAPAVYWIGTTTPLHAQDQDQWYNPAAAVTLHEPFTGLAARRLSTSDETIDRLSPLIGQPVNSGTMRLTFFTATRTETISALRVVTGGAAGAKPSLVQWGVYQENIDGSLKLIVATVNDTNALAVGNTTYTLPLASAWNKVRQQRYAYGQLIVTAAAAPTILGIAAAPGIVNRWFDTPKLAAQQAGLAALPATVPVTSMRASGQYAYIEAAR